MVDALLDMMMGPFRVVSQFYIEHQVIFNPIIVGIAAWKLISNKKKDQNEATQMSE